MTDTILTTAKLDDEGKIQDTAGMDGQIEVNFLIRELYAGYPDRPNPEIIDALNERGIHLDEIQFIHDILDPEEEDLTEEQIESLLLEPNKVKADIQALVEVFKDSNKYEPYHDKFESMKLLCDKALQDGSSVMSFYY